MKSAKQEGTNLTEFSNTGDNARLEAEGWRSIHQPNGVYKTNMVLMTSVLSQPPEPLELVVVRVRQDIFIEKAPDYQLAYRSGDRNDPDKWDWMMMSVTKVLMIRWEKVPAETFQWWMPLPEKGT